MERIHYQQRLEYYGFEQKLLESLEAQIKVYEIARKAVVKSSDKNYLRDFEGFFENVFGPKPLSDYNLSLMNNSELFASLNVKRLIAKIEEFKKFLTSDLEEKASKKIKSKPL